MLSVLEYPQLIIDRERYHHDDNLSTLLRHVEGYGGFFMIQSPFRDLASRRISIGVTGFSRAGKTVFIGALAQALLSAGAWANRRGQGPLAHFGPFERGHFRSARIRDDVHGDEPQFPFRKVRDALCGDDARWPAPTEGLSRLVLDLAIEPKSNARRWLSETVGLEALGLGHLQLELIDYPGEWLVDLPMLQLDYARWSETMLTRARHGQRHQLSEGFFAQIESMPPAPVFDEDLAITLAEAWADYLQQAAGVGLVLNQPGRLLRPGRLAHSPVLRLVPLPPSWAESPFYAGMQDRFMQYRQSVIQPFYREHFARIDRQIVLVDLLRALQYGQEAFDEMTAALADTLKSFDYSKGGWLSWLTGARTTHVLFAATKADHVTRGDRTNLETLLQRMLVELDSQHTLRGTSLRHAAMSLASIRATQDRMTDTPPRREVLFGRRTGDEQPDQWDPGGLPLDFPPDWHNLHFEFLDFEPVQSRDALHEGFPTLHLGKVLDFLIGEDLS